MWFRMSKFFLCTSLPSPVPGFFQCQTECHAGMWCDMGTKSPHLPLHGHEHGCRHFSKLERLEPGTSEITCAGGLVGLFTPSSRWIPGQDLKRGLPRRRRSLGPEFWRIGSLVRHLQRAAEGLTRSDTWSAGCRCFRMDVCTVYSCDGRVWCEQFRLELSLGIGRRVSHVWRVGFRYVMITGGQGRRVYWCYPCLFPYKKI